MNSFANHGPFRRPSFEVCEPRYCPSGIGFTEHVVLESDVVGGSLVRTADFDRDGDLDVLFATNVGSTGRAAFGWYKNNGVGVEFDGPRIIANSEANYSDIEVGDVDGDGDQDAFSIGPDGPTWFENENGLGGFGAPQVVDTDAGDSLELGDIDRDGDLDLLVGNDSQRRSAWYENTNSMGHFGPRKEITGDAIRPLLVDVDGDGDLDIVKFSIVGNRIYVRWNENLVEPVRFDQSRRIGRISTIYVDQLGAMAADIDGDQDVDVILWGRGLGIVWLENRVGTLGGRTLAPREELIARVSADTVSAADMDGDGDLDVLTSSFSEIAWFENRDAGFSFASKHLVAITNSPSGISASDMDGDGDLDVVAAIPDFDLIAWHENADGLGSFRWQHDVAFSAAVNSVDVGDLNGDGNRDLLLGSPLGLYWYANTGPFRDFDVARRITALPVNRAQGIDMDFDGDLDIFVAFSSGRHAWFENLDGIGTFSPTSLGTFAFVAFADLDGDGDLDGISLIDLRFHWHETHGGEVGLGPRHDLGIIKIVPADTSSDEPAEPPSVLTGDIDGDGDLDLVATPLARLSDIVWHENLDGNGDFGPAHLIAHSGILPRTALADIDRDGDLDVLAIMGDSGRDAFLFENDGEGRFAQSSRVPSLEGVLFAVADINADGLNDIVSFSDRVRPSLVWHEQENIDGIYGQVQTIGQMPKPRIRRSLIVADLNGDSDLDVLTASAWPHRIVWYESDLAKAAGKTDLAGDTNRDGAVSFEDFLVLSVSFSATDSVWEDGDFNGDGMVTFEDFLLLAENFGKKVLPD